MAKITTKVSANTDPLSEQPATDQTLTDGSQKTAIVDSLGNDVSDPYINSITVVDHLHEEVHEGHFFSYSVDFSLNSGISSYFLGIPDGKNIHFSKFTIKTDGGPITIEFFENPTITNNGVPQTGYNRNRVLNTAQTLSVFSGPTVSNDGTRMAVTKIFSTNQNRAGDVEMPVEWILKSGNNYCFKITNSGNSTVNIVADFFWYEI